MLSTWQKDSRTFDASDEKEVLNVAVEPDQVTDIGAGRCVKRDPRFSCHCRGVAKG